jgi:hypothetical protein
VPYCLISANLDARLKKRKDEKEAAQLAKRQKTAPDSKPAARTNTTVKVEKDKDKSGCIVYKAGSPMPTFDHLDPKKRVCPAPTSVMGYSAAASPRVAAPCSTRRSPTFGTPTH